MRDQEVPGPGQQGIPAITLDDAIVAVISDADFRLDDKIAIRRWYRSFGAEAIADPRWVYDPNLLVRSDAVGRIGGFNPSADLQDFLLRLAQVGLVYHVPEVLHRFRRSGS